MDSSSKKGGVTKYEVMIGQLLLTDLTVVNVTPFAGITGMIGVHLLKNLGLARLYPKTGSFGSTAIGGLLFGVGFAILGYCPGTIAGAVGEGFFDPLFGGVVEILLRAGSFGETYPCYWYLSLWSPPNLVFLTHSGICLIQAGTFASLLAVLLLSASVFFLDLLFLPGCFLPDFLRDTVRILFR